MAASDGFRSLLIASDLASGRRYLSAEPPFVEVEEEERNEKGRVIGTIYKQVQEEGPRRVATVTGVNDATEFASVKRGLDLFQVSASGCFRVRPGASGCFWVLPSASGCFRALLSASACFCVLLSTSEYLWVLLSTSECF